MTLTRIYIIQPQSTPTITEPPTMIDFGRLQGISYRLLKMHGHWQRLPSLPPPHSTDTCRYSAQHLQKALTKSVWSLTKKIESLTMVCGKWLPPFIWWTGPGDCVCRQFWLSSCPPPSTGCRGSRLGGTFGRCRILGRTEQLHKVLTKGGPFPLPLAPPWLRIILIFSLSFCTLRHGFWWTY